MKRISTKFSLRVETRFFFSIAVSFWQTKKKKMKLSLSVNSITSHIWILDVSSVVTLCIKICAFRKLFCWVSFHFQGVSFIVMEINCQSTVFCDKVDSNKKSVKPKIRLLLSIQGLFSCITKNASLHCNQIRV